LENNPNVINLGDAVLEYDFYEALPSNGFVLFSHGDGSSKSSPRNIVIAKELRKHGYSSFLFDLLTLDEQRKKGYSSDLNYRKYFDLTDDRLFRVIKWLIDNRYIGTDGFTLIGSGRGAAIAILNAIRHQNYVKVLICRGGNFVNLPKDLDYNKIKANTLFIVGAEDKNRALNIDIYNKIRNKNKEYYEIKDADKLFSAPYNALTEVASKISSYVQEYFPSQTKVKDKQPTNNDNEVEGSPIIEDHYGSMGSILSDQPTDVDQLGRAGIAKVISMVLRNIRLQRKGPFLLHINGKWGSGKSSLLRFLRKELEKDFDQLQKEYPEYIIRPLLDKKCDNGRWVIINYNAWQLQRAGPSWWMLIDSLYSQAVKSSVLTWKVKQKVRLLERIWRIRNGISHRFLIPSLFLIGFFSVLLILALLNSSVNAAFFDKGIVDYLTKNPIDLGIIGTLVTLIVSLVTVSKTLIPGSTQTADEFIGKVNDPMNKLNRHFYQLLGWIGNPVVFFIDDLDRCNHDYTVELLERIQTIYREDTVHKSSIVDSFYSKIKKKGCSDKPDVVYVIAADRRWLYSSYDKYFEIFLSYMNEEGRPLRYAFLDKIFQTSISVPPVSKTFKKDYWNSLIKQEPIRSDTTIKDQNSQTQETVDLNKNEFKNSRFTEVLKSVKTDPSDNAYDEENRLTEASLRLVSPELEKEAQSFLKPYEILLDDNPRQMKIVVNTFIMNLAIQVRSRGSEYLDEHKIALLTILSVRWPRLCEYLSQYPEKVDQVVAKWNNLQTTNADDRTIGQNKFPEDLLNLFDNPSVINVIQGKINNSNKGSLTSADLRKFGYY
jgi:hypothetical protein